jgi:hypothetical protein
MLYFSLLTSLLSLSEGRASAQSVLVETLLRHGVVLGERGVEGAFDSGVAPTTPISAGAFAAPLALMATGTPRERVDAAYAFGILAGRSAKGVASQDLAAAARALTQLMVSGVRRGRIAGARVAGRTMAVGFDVRTVNYPEGLIEGVFNVLNQPNETEQLAAMDALGLLRCATAVAALNERYAFYRSANKRAAAGGALEALARIGDPSSVELVKQLAADKWSSGKDATALAVAFARERLLKDGSVAIIQQAVGDKSRSVQARGYLIELGVAVP